MLLNKIYSNKTVSFITNYYFSFLQAYVFQVFTVHFLNFVMTYVPTVTNFHDIQHNAMYVLSATSSFFGISVYFVIYVHIVI